MERLYRLGDVFKRAGAQRLLQNENKDPISQSPAVATCCAFTVTYSNGRFPGDKSVLTAKFCDQLLVIRKLI